MATTRVLPTLFALVLPILASAQSGSLTLEQRLQRVEDELAIRKVLVDYPVTQDKHDYDGYASLFAAQGEWVYGPNVYKGRAAIKQMLIDLYGPTPPGYVNGESVHISFNAEVAVDGDRATAHTRHLLLMRGASGLPEPMLHGRYDDEFIREDGQWKILRRVDVPVIPTFDEWNRIIRERRAGLSTLNPAALVQEQQQVIQWKSDRVASLTSDTGWLTLTGLFWLKPGANTFGSAATNTLHLEHALLAPEAGTFFLEGSTVRFVAAGMNSGVTYAGAPVTDVALAADITDDPTILQSGSLSFNVIDRTGNLGIRVRDSAHPLRTAFDGLDYFLYDNSWVMDAKFEPYEPHKQIPIVNILGMTENIPAAGALVFTHGGIEYRLDALLETPDAEELFIMFADDTTGKETYGAGRYLYVPLPRDGLVRVNFNTAYNPPCAFNVFATCPLPPPQNRLAARVEAGELTYESPHLDE